MILNLYHLVLVVGVWLLIRLKIFENLSGFHHMSGGVTVIRNTYFSSTLKNYIAVTTHHKNINLAGN